MLHPWCLSFPILCEKNHGQKMNNGQFGFNDTLSSNTCLILHHRNVKTSTIDTPPPPKKKVQTGLVLAYVSPESGPCGTPHNNGCGLYMYAGNLFLGKKNISTFIFLWLFSCPNIVSISREDNMLLRCL